MEARIARLESDVAHVRTDMTDVKAGLRALRDKMDAMTERFDGKFEALKDSISKATTWALLLYIALAAAMYGTMARAFGWL